MNCSIISLVAILLLVFLSDNSLARQVLVKKVAAGSASTCALLENGKVKCFGPATAGVLVNGASSGNQIAMGDDLPEANISVLAKDIQVGHDHFCVISTENAVKCWGNNRKGACGQPTTTTELSNIGDNPNELGDGLPFVNLGAGRTAVQIALGPAFSCVLLDNGTVKCWGHGTSGRLGQSATTDITDPSSIPPIDFGASGSVKQICAGGQYTSANYINVISEGFACAILADDSLRCWGEGSGGQLGTGLTTDIGFSAATSTNIQSSINLGTGRTAKQVTCGAKHTCVLLDNNTVRCFGKNDQGQLGIGTTVDSGTKTGDDLDLVQLPAGRHPIKLAAGGSTTCAILDDRSMTCWGNGMSGQLLRGSTTDALFGDEALIFANGALRKNRFAYVSLSVGLYLMPAKAGHTCAILSDSLSAPGDLVCWGTGNAGQLGYGTVGGLSNLGEAEGEEGTDTFPPNVDLGTIEDDGEEETTKSPTVSGGETPSTSPSQAPSQSSGEPSSLSPTKSPSHSPTKPVTNVPTKSPSRSPSKSPSRSPSASPTTTLDDDASTNSPSQTPTTSPGEDSGSDSSKSDTLDAQTVNTIAGVAAAVGVGAMAVGAFLYFRRKKRLATPVPLIENTNGFEAQLIQHQDQQV